MARVRRRRRQRYNRGDSSRPSLLPTATSTGRSLLLFFLSPLPSPPSLPLCSLPLLVFLYLPPVVPLTFGSDSSFALEGPPQIHKSSPRSHPKVLPGHWSPRSSPGFPQVLPGPPRSSQVLPGHPGHLQVLPGPPQVLPRSHPQVLPMSSPGHSVLPPQVLPVLPRSPESLPGPPQVLLGPPQVPPVLPPQVLPGPPQSPGPPGPPKSPSQSPSPKSPLPPQIPPLPNPPPPKSPSQIPSQTPLPNPPPKSPSQIPKGFVLPLVLLYGGLRFCLIITSSPFRTLF
ncbi:hypothetical protein H6P81_007136 [Aristolochia fimbriata]|uniref:Vegetative cell wall protein gp1-like n=1 Tax=Aristolochia fimbriata TaxID=158543 RepID=A0AAV7F358_ARIFI|nr:hypothetical protein H6P81_007136 [Aristolochia fimbriata]